MYARIAAATSEHPQSDGDNLRAARAIIDGDTANPDIDPSFYGYGLELICAGSGKELPVDALSGISSFWLDEEGCHIFNALTQSDCPFDLPESDSGFPGIFFVPAGEISNRMAELEAPDRSVQDEDVDAGVAELLGWLDAARQARRDIIVFFY